MREREGWKLVQKKWGIFRKELMEQGLGEEEVGTSIGGGSGGGGGGGNDENAPPEIATTVRRIRHLQEQVTALENQVYKETKECESVKRQFQNLEGLHQEQTVQTDQMKEELMVAKEELKQSEMEILSAKAKEDVWKRERDNLRSLLETYKTIENKVAVRGSKPLVEESMKQQGQDSKYDPSTEGLQVALKSAKEENDIIKRRLEDLKSQKETIESEHESLKEENAKVVEKFGKLRDALYQEREKASNAEDRAFKAETMAGKGSFNADSTQVLHLQNNPYDEAVREKYSKEILELKTFIEEKEREIAEYRSIKSGSATATATVSSTRKTKDGSLDAQKFNKRLKESFREQIGLFREGVYLITGYKIDMLSDSDRPRFKVRSVFSEREDDHLMFIWPKVEEGVSPKCLDLVNTEMAQVLSEEDSFQYMKKFNSTPAFMASVTLSLFERQTLV